MDTCAIASEAGVGTYLREFESRPGKRKMARTSGNRSSTASAGAAIADNEAARELMR